MKTSSSADLIFAMISGGVVSDKYPPLQTSWEARSRQRSHSSKPTPPPHPPPPHVLPRNFHFAKKSQDKMTPIGGCLSRVMRLCTGSVSAGSLCSHSPKTSQALRNSKQLVRVGGGAVGDKRV